MAALDSLGKLWLKLRIWVNLLVRFFFLLLLVRCFFILFYLLIDLFLFNLIFPNHPSTDLNSIFLFNLISPTHPQTYFNTHGRCCGRHYKRCINFYTLSVIHAPGMEYNIFFIHISKIFVRHAFFFYSHRVNNKQNEHWRFREHCRAHTLSRLHYVAPNQAAKFDTKQVHDVM